MPYYPTEDYRIHLPFTGPNVVFILFKTWISSTLFKGWISSQLLITWQYNMMLVYIMFSGYIYKKIDQWIEMTTKNISPKSVHSTSIHWQKQKKSAITYKTHPRRLGCACTHQLLWKPKSSFMGWWCWCSPFLPVAERVDISKLWMYQIEALLLNPISSKQTEVVYRKSVHRKASFSIAWNIKTSPRR